MFTRASIDFCSFVIQVIRDSFNDNAMRLSYPILITRIMAHFHVEFLPLEPMESCQRPFSKAPVSCSLAQVSRKHQHGIASGTVGESSVDVVAEFKLSFGTSPSHVLPSVSPDALIEITNLLTFISQKQSDMDTHLANLEKIAETNATQWKQLKLDVNNILAHVKPTKKGTHVAKIVIKPISYTGSSSSTTAPTSSAFGDDDEDEHVTDVAIDSSSSSLPPDDLVAAKARSKSWSKLHHDG